MKPTTAIIISNDGIQTRTFEVGVTHTEIHDMVGGWFDCVRTNSLIGYVHDTGLIDGQHINFVATALFGRILCGTCVVFGAMNEDGEYDGDDHNVPENDLRIIIHHAETYRMWLQAIADKRPAKKNTEYMNGGLV
jgi:hypothetical protein